MKVSVSLSGRKLKRLNVKPSEADMLARKIGNLKPTTLKEKISRSHQMMDEQEKYDKMR